MEKKEYQEKLFNRFNLRDRVPYTNFYKRFKGVDDLCFLYPLPRIIMATAARRASTKWGSPLLKPLGQEREIHNRQGDPKTIELDIGHVQDGIPYRIWLIE